MHRDLRPPDVLTIELVVAIVELRHHGKFRRDR
jgi:hypothetical protein